VKVRIRLDFALLADIVKGNLEPPAKGLCAKIELTRIEAAREAKARRDEMAKKYPNDPFAADFKC
jgi:hypothetical protein